MQHLHQEYFKSYFYLLRKANLSNIKEKNQEQLQDNETFMYMEIDLR